jgi:hypothetical protein
MQHGGIQTIQGGFIPEWQPLPVRIRGQIDRGVAQLSLHVGERFALLQHETQQQSSMESNLGPAETSLPQLSVSCSKS